MSIWNFEILDFFRNLKNFDQKFENVDQISDQKFEIFDQIFSFQKFHFFDEKIFSIFFFDLEKKNENFWF